MRIREWQQRVHKLAKEKGFHEKASFEDLVPVGLVAERIAQCASSIQVLRGSAPIEIESPRRWASWDDRTKSIRLARLALIVTEVAELMEAVMNEDEHAMAEEYADIMIRVMDSATADGFPDLEEHIFDKHVKNCSRPHKHGRKL